MEHELIGWLMRYGAPLLFLAQVFGIFGLPIPDELLLTLSGVLISKGVLHGPTTVAAAVSGCLVGITASYGLGRVVGIALLRERFDSHRHAIDLAQAWFRRFGGWLLAFGYFIPGVRHVTAISAGSGCLDYRTFAAYAYPGGILWCTVFLTIGYYAGDRWHEILRIAHSRLTLGAMAIAGVVVVYALVRMKLALTRPPREHDHA